MNVNREIYRRNYSPENLLLRPESAYDRGIIDLRFSYIESCGAGRDVLDLCCGSGSYLIPFLDRVKSAVAVDFSPKMLDGLRRNLGGAVPEHLTLVEADATALPLDDQTVDFVFSYASLYYIPRVDLALREVSRVLRPGGRAILELGNSNSLNTLVNWAQHRDKGWAKPYFIPYSGMDEMIREAGLKILEWRPFQILPMYGAPRRLMLLYPLLTPAWKSLMGIRFGGRMLDEWLSRLWPLRHAAFRHFFLAGKS